MPAEAPSPDEPVIPGTLLEVAGLGVLLRGESGVGKTDLALSLLDRGHCLIVDDAVALTPREGRLRGHAPAALRGLVAVRGLGVLPVQRLFDGSRLKDGCDIDLVIDLDPAPPGPDPLAVEHDSVTIEGVAIPRLRLPLGRDRDRALLIELAVKAERLRRDGWNAAQALAVMGGE
jgi:Serine kinase of the HPr protein, regulates carbohydrate metabolism